MKKNHVLSIVMIIALFSCSKSDNNSVISSGSNTVQPSVYYATAIVGSWQLVEVGIPTSNSGQGGCGSDYSESSHVSWSSAAESVKMTFDTEGVYKQEKDADASCKGNYQIGGNIISIISNCGPSTISHPILAINSSSLIVERTDDSQNRQFKYQRCCK